MQRLADTRRRLAGSWLGDLGRRLQAADVVNAIIIFGAALLLSALPLFILLGSLADRRIDTDLSRHIGLDNQGAAIVRRLFRSSPVHSAGPVVIGLVIALAGTLALVASLQVMYERVFDQPPRGWRDLPRFVVWVAVLLGALTVEGALDDRVRRGAGPVVERLLGFVAVTIFLWWTMHFLLAGRRSWRTLVRPAFVTSVMWLGLGLFSSVYFSSTVISDNRLYGTIGVVFTLLTWFIAIGAVLVLGSALGALWQEGAEARADAAGPASASTDPGADRSRGPGGM